MLPPLATKHPPVRCSLSPYYKYCPRIGQSSCLVRCSLCLICKHCPFMGRCCYRWQQNTLWCGAPSGPSLTANTTLAWASAATARSQAPSWCDAHSTPTASTALAWARSFKRLFAGRGENDTLIPGPASSVDSLTKANGQNRAHDAQNNGDKVRIGIIQRDSAPAAARIVR